MLYKIESLRGILACLVIVAHSSVNVNDNPIELWNNLEIILECFFIISGMVVALAYEDKIKLGLSFKSYFILRIGRVYPLYIFTLLLWLFYILFKQVNGLDVEFYLNDNIWTFWSNVFMIQSFGIHDSLNWNFPSWTVSTEFYIYLLFYFLLITWDKKQKLLVPILISLSSYAYLLSLNRGFIEFTIDYGAIRTMGTFYLGVFIFRIKKKIKLNIGRAPNLYEVIPILVFAFLVRVSDRYFLHDIYMIFALASIVYVFSEKESGIIGKILNLKILRTLGKYSYSIYLLHYFVLSIYKLFFKYGLGINIDSARGINSLILNGVFCVTTIFLSRYSYIFIEDYFRKKSKKIVSQKL